jgi:hypothetical protein
VPNNDSGNRPPAQDVTAQDRATQVAIGVIRVVTESLRDWVHGDLRVPRPVRREIETLLHEFEDAACQARGERVPPTG